MANNIQLQDYLVRYRRMETDLSRHEKPMEYTVPATLTKLMLENLSPNSTYHVSLAARTKYGVGVAAQIQLKTESNGRSFVVLSYIYDRIILIINRWLYKFTCASMFLTDSLNVISVISTVSTPPDSVQRLSSWDWRKILRKVKQENMFSPNLLSKKQFRNKR